MNEEPVHVLRSNENFQKKHAAKNKFHSDEFSFTREKKKAKNSTESSQSGAADIPGEENSFFPWRHIACVLGVICLFLIAAAMVITVFIANSSSERTSFTIQQKGLHYPPCPKNWVWFRCSCYFFSKDNLTWKESQRACLSLNSSLVKINKEEMDFFVLKSFFWVGVYYDAISREWLWENDLALSTDKSCSLETSKQQFCLSYQSKVLCFAENCESKRKYICKKNQVYPMKSQEI